VHDYLELWNWDGTLERMHHALYVAVREQEGREASPTVAIIDSLTAERIFADGGYAGEKMALVVRRTGAWKLEIVKRSYASGFEVLHKRWIVANWRGTCAASRQARVKRQWLEQMELFYIHAQVSFSKSLALTALWLS